MGIDNNFYIHIIYKKYLKIHNIYQHHISYLIHFIINRIMKNFNRVKTFFYKF